MKRRDRARGRGGMGLRYMGSERDRGWEGNGLMQGRDGVRVRGVSHYPFTRGENNPNKRENFNRAIEGGSLRGHEAKEVTCLLHSSLWPSVCAFCLVFSSSLSFLLVPLLA